MLSEILRPLVFSWMAALSPPDLAAARVTYPEAMETADERTVRYFEIADAVTHAVEGLPAGERKGAAELLIAVAWHEGGFQKDVDIGPCAPRRLKAGGCDGGRAKSLWQIQGHDEDVGTREGAARTALRLARMSLRSCAKLASEEKLAMYAAGTCGSRIGQKRSREIWSVLRRIRSMPTLKSEDLHVSRGSR